MKQTLMVAAMIIGFLRVGKVEADSYESKQPTIVKKTQIKWLMKQPGKRPLKTHKKIREPNAMQLAALGLPADYLKKGK